jgi:hypothetical protein
MTSARWLLPPCNPRAHRRTPCGTRVQHPTDGEWHVGNQVAGRRVSYARPSGCSELQALGQLGGAAFDLGKPQYLQRFGCREQVIDSGVLLLGTTLTDFRLISLQPNDRVNEGSVVSCHACPEVPCVPV